MPDVVFISHFGVRCALPSRQVVGAEQLQSQNEPISLWQGSPTVADAADDRLIEVSTGAGTKCVSCHRVRMGRLASALVWHLPPLLKDVLSLPHVVGVAEVERELVWLVDLTRFAPSRPGSQLNQ